MNVCWERFCGKIYLEIAVRVVLCVYMLCSHARWWKDALFSQGFDKVIFKKWFLAIDNKEMISHVVLLL